MANKANARHRALGLIKDEHRSLAAVVHALQSLARQMSEGKEPNQTLLAAIAAVSLTQSTRRRRR